MVCGLAKILALWAVGPVTVLALVAILFVFNGTGLWTTDRMSAGLALAGRAGPSVTVLVITVIELTLRMIAIHFFQIS